MSNPSRRQALVVIAGAGALSACGPHLDTPEERLALLDAAVDRVIPESETPGAAAAGVGKMLLEDAAEDEELKQALDDVLAALDRVGFADRDAAGRDALLSEWMNAEGADADRFRLLKDWTIDRYYATEIGLVDELGYQGNTYLAEFPGCEHEHFEESV